MKKLLLFFLLLPQLISATQLTMPCFSKNNIKWYAQKFSRDYKKEKLYESAAVVSGLGVVALTGYATYRKSQHHPDWPAYRLALSFLRDSTWGFISTAFGFYTVYSLKNIADDSYSFFKEQTKIEILRQSLKYYAGQLCKPSLAQQQQDYYKKQIVVTCNRLNRELEKLCGYFLFLGVPDTSLQDMASTFYKCLEEALNAPTSDGTHISEIIDDFYYNLGNLLYDTENNSGQL